MTKAEHFIAHMKLQELRQQRPRLFQIYEELERQVEQDPTKIQQAQKLFSSLQKIKQLGVALHPDVANLELLLNGPQPSDETISFWHTQLIDELSQGRLRSELNYTFGALLEEWIQEKDHEATPDPTSTETYEQFLETVSHAPKSTPDNALLDALFEDRNFLQKDIASWFQTTAKDIFRDRITTYEVNTVLESLKASSENTASIRTQAKSLAQNSVMCKEMADALSILLTHLDEWDWPEEGVEIFPLWALNKWRIYISYDFFTMCFLEILGTRLQNTFQQFLEEEREERAQQLREILKEPAMDKQENQIEQALHLYRLANSDVWKNLSTDLDTPLTREFLQTYVDDDEYHSIIMQRKRMRKRLVQANTTLGGYGTSNEIDGMKLALQFINAEIELTRTVYPTHPLYVLKMDLSAFYPTLPHELVLAVLERYGFSQSQLTFFRKVLQVRFRHDAEQANFQCGVPLDYKFSSVLGEMVLHLMDQHILRNARVQVIRMVDDICILASTEAEAVQAWNAALEFCEGVGLTINQKKCGAVCIQGEQSSQLPASLPTWLLVKLNAHGAWQVDMENVMAYHQQVRQRVLHDSSLLSQIEIYNQHVKHLVRAVAMASDLGKEHRRSIEQAAALFHQDFFEPGHGMLEALRDEIQRRFSDQTTVALLPEAWFYWPITAGGCGLTQIMFLASGYAETHSALKERVAPAKRALDWQCKYNDWVGFYSSFILDVDLKTPQATKNMEMLVSDFIKRSNEVGNREQTTLGAYWHWILSIYGPQILKHLGSFRFLITELVPLQLIIQHYQYSLGDDDETTQFSQDNPF